MKITFGLLFLCLASWASAQSRVAVIPTSQGNFLLQENGASINLGESCNDFYNGKEKEEYGSVSVYRNCKNNYYISSATKAAIPLGEGCKDTKGKMTGENAVYRNCGAVWFFSVKTKAIPLSQKACGDFKIISYTDDTTQYKNCKSKFWVDASGKISPFRSGVSL